MSAPPTGVDVAIGGLVAIVTAVVGWATGRRTTSGSINTSTAKDLWDASEDLRNTFAQEVKDLREQVGKLTDEVRQARQETQEAREETRAARQETHEARLETDGLRTSASLANEEVFKLRKQLVLAQAELEDIHRERMDKGPTQ